MKIHMVRATMRMEEQNKSTIYEYDIDNFLLYYVDWVA